MKNRLVMICISSFLLLSACSPLPDKEKDNVNQRIETEEVVGSTAYYTISDYKPGAARGYLPKSIQTETDIDEMETGLMELAQDYFDPDDYLYREGQVLSEDELSKWLKRKSKTYEEGLNPALNFGENDSWEENMEKAKKNPSVIGYIHEQNYVTKNGKLAGAAISIVVNSVDYLTIIDEQGLLHKDQVKISDKEAKKEGMKAASKVAERLRQTEEMNNIPIVFAIYQQGAQNDVAPGHYLAKTLLKKGQANIKEWEQTERETFLFPSKAGNEHDPELSRQLANFKTIMESRFPLFDIPVVTRALFEGDQLQQLTIEMPVEITSYAEKVAFTEYLYNQVVTGALPGYVPIYIYVKSFDEPISIISWDPEEKKAYSHMY
ncbi:CamS family sex pheromone protein [Bacillus marinisedimentorum]|uniref:CamS family sex pheromone protein n=1 Tax=Bacillus marinisedimentorum TaxID=1821260 RepID=UPI0014720093|nr:CamS family sex pheromone protein [Bacillus marinisedimentorum]